MYITTSRKPSDATRGLAKAIANFLGVYENRGKKTIAEIATRAGKLGHSRAMIISESGGNPNSLVFMSVDEEWNWLEPEITFTKFSFPKIGKLGKQAKYTGDVKYSDLFDLHEPDTDDAVAVGMDGKRLVISHRKLKLEITVKELRNLEKDE